MNYQYNIRFLNLFANIVETTQSLLKKYKQFAQNIEKEKPCFFKKHGLIINFKAFTIKNIIISIIFKQNSYLTLLALIA